MSIGIDDDFERSVRDRLHAAGALKAPSAHLEARTRQRERHHARQLSATRFGAVAVAGVVVVGGIVAIQRTHTEPSATLTASANADAGALFPILDLSGVPQPFRDKVGASYFQSVSDEWAGVLGTTSSGEGEQNLVVITVFPIGTQVALDDEKPGRRTGVSEVAHLEGGHTLFWTVGDVPFSAFGSDLNTLYALIDVVEPIDGSGTRGGYQFTAPLPTGLEELVVPTHRKPHNGPSLSTDDGALDVAVYELSPLTLLVTGGNFSVETTRVNDMDVAVGRHGVWTAVAIAVSPSKTMLISSNTLDLQHLAQVAEHIKMVDESTWRQHYGLQDSPTQIVAPTTTAG